MEPDELTRRALYTCTLRSPASQHCAATGNAMIDVVRYRLVATFQLASIEAGCPRKPEIAQE
jgi:hypothetical protein